MNEQEKTKMREIIAEAREALDIAENNDEAQFALFVLEGDRVKKTAAASVLTKAKMATHLMEDSRVLGVVRRILAKAAANRLADDNRVEVVEGEAR